MWVVVLVSKTTCQKFLFSGAPDLREMFCDGSSTQSSQLITGLGSVGRDFFLLFFILQNAPLVKNIF